MFRDIIRPEGNEKEFFRMAERLGIKELALYCEKQVSLFELQKETSIKLCTAGKKKADVTIKGAEEQGKTDLIICPSRPMKHIFYKELNKSGTALCFPLADIIEAKGARRVALLDNLSRHIRLCRKHKVRLVAATFASDPYQMRSEIDIRALLAAMGMGTKEVKEAL